MIILAATAYSLIVLHGVGGIEITLNPAEIVSMRERPADNHGKDDLLTPEVWCMINTTDGKFITVVDHCDKVRELIREEIKRLQGKKE